MNYFVFGFAALMWGGGSAPPFGWPLKSWAMPLAKLRWRCFWSARRTR